MGVMSWTSGKAMQEGKLNRNEVVWMRQRQGVEWQAANFT